MWLAYDLRQLQDIAAMVREMADDEKLTPDAWLTAQMRRTV